MISKMRIERKIERKRNPELVNTLIQLKKKFPEIAKDVGRPVKKQIKLNLRAIDKVSKAGENIVICGKVLSGGELSKKINIVALGFSEMAIEKIKKSGSDFSLLKDSLDKKLNDFKMLRVFLTNSSYFKKICVSINAVALIIGEGIIKNFFVKFIFRFSWEVLKKTSCLGLPETIIELGLVFRKLVK